MLIYSIIFTSFVPEMPISCLAIINKVIKKIVISPNNKEAIAFFDEIAKRKAEIKKRLEEKAAKRLLAHKTHR